MMEAVFAVTPSETIKYVYACPLQCRVSHHMLVWHRTKLIDDAKSSNPRFRGLIHGTGVIVREEGLRGIYRGLFPVVCLRLGFITEAHCRRMPLR